MSWISPGSVRQLRLSACSDTTPYTLVIRPVTASRPSFFDFFAARWAASAAAYLARARAMALAEMRAMRSSRFFRAMAVTSSTRAVRPDATTREPFGIWTSAYARSTGRDTKRGKARRNG